MDVLNVAAEMIIEEQRAAEKAAQKQRR